jgi:redox-sensing transcriptional repressor
VVVIGAGQVGRALAQYGGLSTRGFLVQWVYDVDPLKIGTPLNGVTVRDLAALEGDFPGGGPDMAILATPGEAAQAVADRLVRLGVRAMLNFAPVHLVVPPDVAVKNVNMAIELETLSYALRHS